MGMEIATNAVLLAVLVDISAAVKNLGLPLATPLVESNVVHFRVFPSLLSLTETGVSSHLVYRGGYEFWHDGGCVSGFGTPDAYTLLQRQGEGRRLLGTVRHSEEECLQKARLAIRQLGFTNATMLGTRPRVDEAPSQWDSGVLPRYVFEWLGEDSLATCEVNADRLSVEYLCVAGREFQRRPWPVTFGQTNAVEAPKPRKSARTEMAVQGVSREYAMAFVRKILPDASRFCAKLGLPLPDPITEADLNLPESEVSINHGRVQASLRLRVGQLVTYYAGHVWGVEAEDAYRTQPYYREKVRESEEFRGPIRVSQQEAVAKVRCILLEGLGLPPKPLFIDTDPIHVRTPNPKATEGVRRYVFRWQRPETPEERAERIARGFVPEISVAAEVDAVSGALKSISFRHRFFERPDPVIDVPMNDRAGSAQK
jgi:hypothetical protein